MSEYIITSGQFERAVIAIQGQLDRPINEVFIAGHKLPELVRCRDCARVKGILPDPETGETKPCCTMFGFLVGSEGFCAWGEKVEK